MNFSNDVRREREGRGCPNSDIVSDFSTADWSKIVTRGEGVNNPEKLADVICERPLRCQVQLDWVPFTNDVS